jgi:hypothetical protein
MINEETINLPQRRKGAKKAQGKQAIIFPVSLSSSRLLFAPLRETFYW